MVDIENIVASVTLIVGFIILFWAATTAYSYGKESGVTRDYDSGYEWGYEKVTYCLTVFELDPTNVDKVWNCRNTFREHDIDITSVEELAKAKRAQE